MCFRACEKCLDVYREKTKGCGCGHNTPALTSVELFNWLVAAGEEQVVSAAQKRIKRLLGQDGEVAVITESGQMIKAKTDVFLAGVKIDAKQIYPVQTLAKAGTPVVNYTIGEMKKELQEVMGHEISFENAAAILAHSRYRETGEFAKVVVQKVSGLSLTEFSLGEDVILGDSLLVKEGAEYVILVMGDAKIKIAFCEVRISEPVYPFAVVYQAESFKNSRIFIFI